ncbi:MAG: hypothetical protein LUQ25_06945 [Methanoregulaceae archaeon]|nr:hypothetical protein [Methanoregulaceae archaeon]
MKNGYRFICLLFLVLLIAAITLPAGAVAAAKATKLTLISYTGYGFGGRLTSLQGTQLPFSQPAVIKLYRNGVFLRKTTACGMGYYRFPMAVPHGRYVARFTGQAGLLPAKSNVVWK